MLMQQGISYYAKNAIEFHNFYRISFNNKLLFLCDIPLRFQQLCTEHCAARCTADRVVG